MYGWEKEMIELELLKAKRAIFKMIMQFCIPKDLFNDGKLYIYDYCESALEGCFDVLGIDENFIELETFCRMWEQTERDISAYKTGMFYEGCTWDIFYAVFKESYEHYMKDLEEIKD